MKHLTKLGLAVLLGIVAAAMNYFYLSNQANPPKFVAFKKDVKRGEVIALDMLKPIPIPGDVAELRQTYLEYGERQVLVGQQTHRAFLAGDIFFMRDLAPPDIDTSEEKLGPYTLISVGNRFVNTVKANEAFSNGTENAITIAVPWPYDESTKRLMDIVRKTKSPFEKDKSTIPEDVIQSIAILSPSNTGMTEATGKDAGPGNAEGVNLNLQAGQQAEFIPLSGITNIPRVMQAGQQIGFILRIHRPVLDPRAPKATTPATKTSTP